MIEAWGVCSVMKVLVVCSAEVSNLLEKILTQVSYALLALQAVVTWKIMSLTRSNPRALCGRGRLTYVKREYERVTK